MGRLMGPMGMVSVPSRRRSRRPRMKATSRTQPMPAAMAGTTGLKMTEESAFSAAIARTVGPPQGRMFMTPALRQTMPDSTSRSMPSR